MFDLLITAKPYPPVSMTTTTTETLSKNDLAILGALFDPETSLSANTNLSDSSTPPTKAQPSTSTIPDHVILAEKSILKPLNTPSPSTNDLKIAISKLSHLILENPTYPSLYTNRAQATRLLPNSLTNPTLLHSILSDLHLAISLSTTSVQPTSTNLVLSTAHNHRAYILLSASQIQPTATATATTTGPSHSLFTTLTSLDPTPLGLPLKLTRPKLEELASQDFSIAGKLGDENARRMAVKTNPYAKLCGGIVREALRGEIKEFYEGRV